MARIEGFRVKNYRVIRDITLGKLWNTPTDPLTPITAVIGKNGVGKSTIFDAFGFISDCLKGGVEEACESRSRGGFEKIRSQGKEGTIEFHISYKEDNNTQAITYELEIDIDESGRPYVKKERLRQGRKGQDRGFSFSFLMLNEGRDIAWKGEEEGKKIEEHIEQIDLFRLIERIQHGEEVEESKEIELVELEDTRKLGIATLGALKQHPRISRFRRFIEGWYLSYFTPEDARNLPLTGPQKHLNIHGDNLANVIQFMEREHPHKFQAILEKISSKIPGINKISTEKSADGRLLIRFNDKGFQEPFYVQ